MLRDTTCAAASGAALLLAAPPDGVPWLVFVALVPLLTAVWRPTVGALGAAALGWLCGALFYAALVPWLLPTIARLQHVGMCAAGAAFAGFVVYHAAQFALAALAVWAIGSTARGTSRAALNGALLAASAWVLSEWGFPKVFPWALGAALGPSPLLRQLVDLTGVYGLTALVVVVNALLARGGAGPIGLAAVLVATCAGYGALSAAGTTRERGARVRVGVVQAGGGPTDDARAAAAAAWDAYASRSFALTRRTDVVVWPEGVLRVYLGDAGDMRDAIERLARDLRRPLVLGALDHAAGGGERNAVFSFAPLLREVRYKQHLVPFGEYVPGPSWLPWLRRWQTTGAFVAGGVATPLSLAGTRAALAVCIEAIRPGVYNAQVRGGAQWLLNLTDDSWFASPRAAAQHLEMARLRAVETRRWLVRASHSGASAVIDPSGRLVAALPFAAVGSLGQAVARGDGLPPYVRAGDWVIVVAALLLTIALARRAGAAMVTPDRTTPLRRRRPRAG